MDSVSRVKSGAIYIEKCKSRVNKGV